MYHFKCKQGKTLKNDNHKKEYNKIDNICIVIIVFVLNNPFIYLI